MLNDVFPYLFVCVVHIKKGQMVPVDMCELSFRFVSLLVNKRVSE